MKKSNSKIKKPFKILIVVVLGVFLFQPLMFATVAGAEDDSDTVIDTGDANVGLGVDNDINQNDTVLDGSSDDSEESSAGDEGDSIIDTGDASVGLDIDNQVNINQLEENYPATSFGETQTEDEDQDDQSSYSEEDLAGEISGENDEAGADCATGAASEAEVDNSNEAEVDNELDGSGSTGENEIGENEGNSQITTGDIGIGALTDNDINGNNTEADCEDECCLIDPDEPKQIEVDNDNTASTANDVLLDGNSGENNIATTTGQAVISTGDINIFNAIINYINTNFFGKGRKFFVNIFSHLIDSIDLSGYGKTEPEDGNLDNGNCVVENCDVTINNSSTSTLANDININANTGINTIENSGTSIIETGDINVLNDVANIANLNVTGNDWFFAVVNIFGFLEGDLILPGINQANPEEETEELVNQAEEAAVEIEKFIVTNGNQADLLNNIDITANTGDNEISDTDGANLIGTGDALINTKAFNLVNLNFIGDKWRLTQVNLFGNWEGLIHGLPDNYSYFEDENGVTIYNDLFNNEIFTSTFAQLEVNNTNSASTTNNIEIAANTGDNGILHGLGGASIDTGDISIKNALLNFINSNFTGNAWEFSMVNVFGDWQGNLAFGQPDLWVTESIDSQYNPLKKGNYITYNFLFGNNGDGLATNVEIIDDFNETFFNVAEAGDGSENGGDILFELSELPPNSQGSISYTVQVKGGVPRGENEAPNTVTIASLEDDRDYSNNSSGGSVIVDGGRSKKDRFNIALSSASLPNLMIVKTNNAEEVVHPGDMIDYQIIIKNTGSASLYDVLVADTMTDESGEKEVNKGFWNLETVYNDEEIVIDYTIEINGNIEEGTYINEAMVEGYDQERGMYLSAVASSKIKVANGNYREDSDEKGLVYVLAEEGAPQLMASKISKTNMANPGDEVAYELVITNNGNLTAFDVKATESLPDGLSFKNEDDKDGWALGDIAPGEFKNIEYIIAVEKSAKPGVYTGTAEVTASNHEAVNASASLEVREVVVLPETGFSAQEPMLLLLALTGLLGVSIILKRRVALW